MPKSISSISIDTDILAVAKLRGLNISKICNEALHASVNTDELEPQKKEIEEIEQELKELKLQWTASKARLNALRAAEKQKVEREQKETFESQIKIGKALKNSGILGKLGQ